MSETDDKTTSGIQVVDRVARILEALSQNPDGMSYGQIAGVTGLPRATVQRIAVALSAHDFITSRGGDAGLLIGPAILRLARAAFSNVVMHCRPIVDELCRVTGETVDLSIYRNGKMVFLDQRTGVHRLQAVSAVGAIYPLVTTANGRSVLMNMRPDLAAELIRNEIAALGLGLAPQEVIALLEADRHDGIARAIDAHTVGISATGFSYRDALGERISISLPVPTARFLETREQIETALRKAMRDVQDSYPGAVLGPE